MKRGALAATAAVVALLLFAGESAPARRTLRVGLVLQSTTTTSDDPYDHLAYVGFERAVRRLGVAGRVVVADPKGGMAPGFLFLARQKYDLVLGYGFLSTGDLDAAAVRFPHTTFAIVDASVRDLPHHPRNVRGGVFASEEPSYLAGYLAGSMEKRRPGRDVVASVGGAKIPTVDAYIAGFQAGARKADPGITTLNGYAKSFTDPGKCEAVTRRQIADGAGVVFQVASACGMGALEAARQARVWGIGVDVDQSALGPFVLTSTVKRLDVGVFKTVRDFTSGRFKTGRDAVFDLANGGVGLGRISPRVPRALVRKADLIRKQIVAGKIRVPSTLGPR